MEDFDLANLHFVSFEDARIETGDLLQFRGRGLISSWIRFATHGVHSHSAMARVGRQGRVDCLEVREWVGGRARPLWGHVVKQPGLIDVFRVRHDVFDVDLYAAVDKMRCLTSKSYGYGGIARLAMQRTPLLWRLFRLETSDIDDGNANRSPFCSHAVAIAYHAGGVDPVPRKPDDLVTPADLTNSLLFDYAFTLTP